MTRVAAGDEDRVEARQRPGPTTQIFDDRIPFGSAPNQGGVIAQGGP